MFFVFSEILQIRFRDGQWLWKIEKNWKKREAFKKNPNRNCHISGNECYGNCSCSRNKLEFLNFLVLDLVTFHTIFLLI